MNRLSRSRLKIAAIGLGALGLTLISGAGAAAHENRGEATIVYTTSNATGGNSVLAFRAERDGGFTSLGSFPTGGSGTGAGLGSQGAIVLTQDSSRLVTVNAGSNSISAFAVDDDGTFACSAPPPPAGTTLPVSPPAGGSSMSSMQGATRSLGCCWELT